MEQQKKPYKESYVDEIANHNSRCGVVDTGLLADTPEAERRYREERRLWREADRLRGLLRFAPDRAGRYIARCAPETEVLSLLADHFTLRFGDTVWAIIDEKRSLVLFRDGARPARLCRLEEWLQAGGDQAAAENPAADGDEWETLWQEYFRSVNNEERTNVRLQQQFIPRRYRKYLPELESVYNVDTL